VSSEPFQELVEQAPDGVVILERGCIVFINATAARLLGVDREAALGTAITTYLPPADAAATMERIGRMLGTGEAMVANEYGTLADPTRCVEIKSIPWRWQDRPAVLAFARDVTDRKTLQQQLLRVDRLAAMGTLAAGVAHEINNPLQYMQLNLQMIEATLKRSGALEPALADCVHAVVHGVDRIAKITRSLRSFARLEEAEPTPVDPVAVVDRALAMVDNELRHRARLEREVVECSWVIADPARLEQVVVNLLVNAIHALTGRDDDTVGVVVRSRPERVEIVVRDTGQGMSDEVLGRVFDPFFTTKRAGGGMGLGLSVSKSIVDAIGGDLVLTSSEGRGTTATVTLPSIAKTHPAPTPAPTGVGGRRRVLVIDDEPRVGAALGRVLRRDHAVVVVDRGPAALSALGDGAFDVIVCDVMMPGMSGVDVYREIEARFPGMERRIVFMTGGSFVPEIAEFVASAGNRVIQKPFQIDQVLAAIAAVS